MVEFEQSGRFPIGQLRKRLSRKKVINHRVNLWGFILYVSIERRRGAKEEMIVVSNFKFEDPLGIYRRRWEIETMFGCLKTRGFRMEDTHVTDPDKIEKVLFVLAIAFCWAYRTGDIQDQKQPIKIKTHGRRARSLFREGLNLIRRVIFSKWIRERFRRLLLCFTYSNPVKVTRYEIIFCPVREKSRPIFQSVKWNVQYRKFSSDFFINSHSSKSVQLFS